jgi:hypothetical protein
MHRPLDYQQHVAPAHQQATTLPHVVHFYEPGYFPSQSIASYLYAGVECGESALIIATPEHTQALLDALNCCGIDTNALEHADLLLCLDANSLVTALRRHGSFSDASVDEALAPPLHRISRTPPNGRSRVFGEMVDLLAVAGDYPASLQLEQQWNRLQAQHSFSLYCAYCTAAFAGENSAAIPGLCHVHDEVMIPASASPPQSWLALLLEQSRALQAAIRRCQTGESTLHALELEYARLFDEHVECWRDRIALGLCSASLLDKPPSSNPSEDLDRVIERMLCKILAECQEACAAKKAAPTGGAESDKYTGEILAYGRLTSALCGLQKTVRQRRLAS